MPHGHCYLWKPDILWTHVLSDSVIVLAYFSIPAALTVFIRRRHDLAYHWVFILFAMFIFACGVTHLMEVWSVWHGTYRLTGAMKAIAAVISLATAVVLWPLIPKALAIPSRLELETVNKNLQYHIAELQQAEAARHESEQRFRAIFENAGIGIAQVNPDQQLILSNRALQDMLGYSGEEFQTMTILDITHSDDATVSDKHFADLVSGQYESFQLDSQYRHKEGHVIWGRLTVSAVRSDVSELRFAIGMIENITSQKRTLEALHQKNLEFERSNRELEEFAYVASHDLRGPLRSIDNLSQWVVEDAGEALPEASRQDLQTMQDRIARMDGFLDGLLQYSRIGRTAALVETVHTRELIDDCVKLLDIPPGFTVDTMANMPVIDTARVPLQLVFQNLISNAIKHHDRRYGTIYISAQTTDAGIEFRVADDGPGIDRQYHEQIFQLFKTLRRRDEVESSGVGLALAKKNR